MPWFMEWNDLTLCSWSSSDFPLFEQGNMSTDSLNHSQEEKFANIIKDYEAQCTVSQIIF